MTAALLLAAWTIAAPVPDDPALLTQAALQLKDQRRYEESEALFARASRIAGDGESLNNLGAIRFLQRKFELAEMDFTRASAMDPADAKALANRCLLRIVTGRPEPALQDCSAAWERDPQNFGAWNNRGFALIELGKTEDAWVFFGGAINSNGSAPEPWLGLALSMVAKGEVKAALKPWKKAVELKPSLAGGAESYEAEEGPFFGPQSLALYNRLRAKWPMKAPKPAEPKPAR